MDCPGFALQPAVGAKPSTLPNYRTSPDGGAARLSFMLGKMIAVHEGRNMQASHPTDDTTQRTLNRAGRVSPVPGKATAMRPLNLLLVEDSEDDAELVLLELRRGGYLADYLRVDVPEEMRAALAARKWDLVIADYVMPRFSGPAALKLLQE